MVTTTNSGIDYLRTLIIDGGSGSIDRVAVGTGTNSESDSSVSLSQPVYDATSASNNVEIKTTNTVGEFVVLIRIKGGTEVPADTEITELGVFIETGTDSILFSIDNFPPIKVESGYTEQFSVKINIDKQ